jgi:hypothetical protein
MLGTLKDLIQGNITTKEWLEGADNTREDYLAGNLSTDEVYGQSEELLTKLETAYTVADMYRELTGADIGIVLGGGYRTSTNGYIYKGDITHNSLLCITPIKETASDPDNVYVGKICVADMTGQQILDTLNSDNCSTDIDRDSHYYVASGLQVTFNPWEGKGKRVISCKLPDGSDIDTEATYKVAYFYNSISSDGLTIDNYLDMTWEESFAKWLDDIGGVVKKPEMTLTLVYE